MTYPEPTLPVAVREVPHWRVVFRPGHYNAESIPTLGDCRRIIERTHVSLRGWDYPQLSPDPSESGSGENWIASWSAFMGHLEYWRFYQSGQFVHLFSVRESTEKKWREKLRADAASHLAPKSGLDWGSVPGFISITNTIYCLTEIFEFATRLCEAGVYRGTTSITIELHGISGFVLSADWNRGWHQHCAASMDVLSHTWPASSDTLIRGRDLTIEAAIWFFERFEWHNPSPKVIEKDVQDLLESKL